ncbi:zinc finger and SCAN domain-containing protein 31-like isoform X2 [Parambassis ranga]|nr:zinc finger and SCAN domain-containing protein 31-like isoform X2 [Parambassis ranga]
MLWTSHGEQLVQKQETDFSIVTYDENDHREPAPNTDVLLSYNSPDRDLLQHEGKEEGFLADRQLCNEQRNSSRDQVEPKPPQIYEKLCTNQEGEQLVQKQETDPLMTTMGQLQLCGEKRDSSQDQEETNHPQIQEEEKKFCTNHETEQLVLMLEPSAVSSPDMDQVLAEQEKSSLNRSEAPVVQNDEINCQRRPLTVILTPELKLHRIDKHNCKVKEVPADQQVCNQQRNSSLDQKKLDPPRVEQQQEELCVNHEGEQDTDTSVVTAASDGNGHSKPGPTGDMALSHNSTNTGKKALKCKPTRKKQIPCTACGKIFKKNCELIDHMRIHTGERPFSCNTCGKNFGRKYHLVSHMKIHTGEKPFSCKTCGKLFAQNSILRRHMRIHTGEKPFTCKTCGKKFGRSFCLTLHIRSHMGVEPFSCKTCGKSFKTSYKLTAHIKTHTDEKLVPKNISGKSSRQSGGRTHAGETLSP